MNDKKGITSAFESISELTYEDFEKLSDLRDVAELNISKTEYRIIFAMYKKALNRMVKKEVVDNCVISQHRKIKNLLGYCGCKECLNKASNEAVITFGKYAYKETFYVCTDHSNDINAGKRCP